MIGPHGLDNLLSYSAQLACIVAIGAALPALLRLHATDARYAYWRTLAVLGLALPWIQPWTAADTAAAGTTQVMTSVTAMAQSATSAAPSRTDWWFLAIVVLAAGAALRGIWLAAGLVRLRRWRTAGTPAPSHERYDELQRRLGTRAEIRYVAGLRQPVTFGLRRPVVLLPDAVRQHTPEIQDAVLTHELCHVQRGDWASVLLEEGVRAVFWFHPAMWWLISRVQLAREELVDEFAVLVTGRRRTYVEALLTFADTTPLAPAPAFARRRHLFRRMTLISREVAMSSKRVVASCAVMAAVVVWSGWYAVSAFPLRQSARQGGVVWGAQPGPLELQAKPLTPENPIPRRIGFAEPAIPSQATDAHGVFTVRVTLDDSGRVGETRILSFRVRTGDATVSFRGIDPRMLTGPGASSAPMIEALGRAVTDAVRMWRYDPPAEAPLAFDVEVPFGEPPPPPPPPPPPMPSRAGAMPPPPPPPPRPAARKTPGIPPPPPPPPPAAPIRQEQDGALRVGNGIMAPKKIRDVRPVYPLIAQQARVEGVVIVEARIEADGRVSSVAVLRSIPLLDEAAIEAVKQWEFTPTLLNGVPTPIIMTTTVAFKLDQE